MIAIGPLPFVGRQHALAALKDALAVMPLVSLHGASGAGKSRLIGELGPALGVPFAVVLCGPGDRAAAVRARAERALRCAAGALVATLAQHARVLVIDDIDALRPEEAASLLAPMQLGPTALGRIVVIGRDRLAALGDAVGELELTGLPHDDAATLWASLPTAPGTQARVAGAFHSAFARTAGLPAALRREHARAELGDAAWDFAALPPPVRDAAIALAVLRVAVVPGALAALVPALGDTALLDRTLGELIARQLVDGTREGRLVLAHAARGPALAATTPAARAGLHRAVADQLATGSLGSLDPLARVREVVAHELAAGEVARAADHVLAQRELGARSGGAGELEGLIDAVDAAGGLDRERAQQLAGLRIELVARTGRVAEAAERAASAPGAAPPLLHAELAAATGDVAAARRMLDGIALTGAPSDRVRAAALLIELELLAGAPEAAAQRLAAHGDLAAADPRARARMHLAAAAVDDFAGRVSAMRAALVRAHGAVASMPPSVESAELGAIIEARRAIQLAREGRVAEATAALDAIDSAARDLEAVAVADEIACARAVIARRRGDSASASSVLHDLVRSRRARGDELGALAAELELAELELVRGQPAVAAELAAAATASSVRRELGHLAARGAAVVGAIEVLEYRVPGAIARLTALHGDPMLDARSAATVAVQLAIANALGGQRTGTIDAAQAAGPDVRDDLDRKLAGATAALAAGEVALALELARETAVLAERGRRSIELAEALVIVARLELARGDRVSARAAATRAAREAAGAGLVRARIHALLALSALARDDDDAASAVAYARDASELALTAGLPVERLVAHAALDAISGAEAVADPAAPSAATITPAGIDASARLLTDLGLTAQRPFRVIDADGVTSDVSDANPEILRLPGRALAVDGVREVIWRHGQELADLRRRSLLKRLLFLFASAPGRVFSKESIVSAVWNVEYHPLRHDAALFTNIMRIRRLLGEDGSEIIRVTEDGYRFVPPRDFLFVTPR